MRVDTNPARKFPVGFIAAGAPGGIFTLDAHYCHFRSRAYVPDIGGRFVGCSGAEGTGAGASPSADPRLGNSGESGGAGRSTGGG